MSECPWYVSAAAVRRYMEITRRGLTFDDASDELIEYAAKTWQRYLADPARRPKITRTGAYTYRGPGPLRISLVVSTEPRPEGPKGAVVDLLPTHGGLK